MEAKKKHSTYELDQQAIKYANGRSGGNRDSYWMGCREGYTAGYLEEKDIMFDEAKFLRWLDLMSEAAQAFVNQENKLKSPSAAYWEGKVSAFNDVKLCLRTKDYLPPKNNQ